MDNRCTQLFRCWNTTVNLSATHVYVVLDSSRRSRRQVRRGRMHGRKLEQRQGSKSGGLSSSRYKVLVAGVVCVTLLS